MHHFTFYFTISRHLSFFHADGKRKAVRFAGNRNHSRHGRVEIFHNDAWGSICLDNWDLHDGHVACTQLGFSGIEKITNEPVDPTSKAVLKSISCYGNESALDNCANGKWGDFTCSTNGYAGVVCKGIFRRSKLVHFYYFLENKMYLC